MGTLFYVVAPSLDYPYGVCYCEHATDEATHLISPLRLCLRAVLNADAESNHSLQLLARAGVLPIELSASLTLFVPRDMSQ